MFKGLTIYWSIWYDLCAQNRKYCRGVTKTESYTKCYEHKKLTLQE